MTEIIPAILPATLDELTHELGRVRGAARLVQIDVVDGIFAPNKTWPYGSAAQKKEFERIALQEEGLPFWEEFDFEIDLMVQDPESAARAWQQAGAARIIVHADTRGASSALVALYSEKGGEEAAFAVGIALPCDASPQALEQFAYHFDFVQVMGIAKAGFQGGPFDLRALNLIRELRQIYPELPLQVDGGVGSTDLRALAAAGANRLIVGSRIFRSANPRGEIEALTQEVNSAR